MPLTPNVFIQFKLKTLRPFICSSSCLNSCRFLLQIAVWIFMLKVFTWDSSVCSSMLGSVLNRLPAWNMKKAAKLRSFLDNLERTRSVHEFLFFFYLGFSAEVLVHSAYPPAKSWCAFNLWSLWSIIMIIMMKQQAWLWFLFFMFWFSAFFPQCFTMFTYAASWRFGSLIARLQLEHNFRICKIASKRRMS